VLGGRVQTAVQKNYYLSDGRAGGGNNGRRADPTPEEIAERAAAIRAKRGLGARD